jgi:HlyD family secretion protein
MNAYISSPDDCCNELVARQVCERITPTSSSCLFVLIYVNDGAAFFAQILLSVLPPRRQGDLAVGKRWKSIIAAAAALLVAGGTGIYLRDRPLTVRVAPIQKDVPIQVFGLGTVEAQTLSKIGFETGGVLVELKADHGDNVKTGALLARLNSREQEARVAQAHAAIAQAKAAVEQAQAAVEKAEFAHKQKVEVNARRQQLVQRGVVSTETAGDAQAAADIAKADLSQAQSAVTVARANLKQAEAVQLLEEARLAKYDLYAPFDGVVMARHKELGSAINANEPVFTLVDPATIWALAYIDEARAGKIEVGQPAVVTRRSAPDLKMTAKVVRIDIESDRVNEERRVYVRCGGCPLTFHVGEQAEVVITVDTLARARLVNLASLSGIKGREATAWTVEDGRLQQRSVTLGQRTLDGRVEIVSGLPEGAEIVNGPTAEFRVGRKVTVAAGEKRQ